MWTGDAQRTADAVGRALGLDEVIGGVAPSEKAEHVKRLQERGLVVAMAGDGVNDAPVLARSDVGIAMGTGTDVAMQSAHVTLVSGDLRGIARARRLSRATMRNIRQNLVWAFAYNVLGVPIAAGMLYPAFGLPLRANVVRDSSPSKPKYRGRRMDSRSRRNHLEFLIVTPRRRVEASLAA